MRDHLLGYPPAATHAAEHEHSVPRVYVDPYPLGEPARVEMGRLVRLVRREQRREDEAKFRTFETQDFPHPDGTRPMSRRDAMAAALISARQKVFAAQITAQMQAQARADAEEARDSGLRHCNQDGPVQSLATTLPAGVCIGGITHVTY